MSVQFGRWNVDRKPVEKSYIEKVNSFLSPYGPDRSGSFSKDHINIVCHALHTTKKSRREVQPHISSSGVVITWDGRLDNAAELIRDLGNVLPTSATDVEVVAAAYERQGTDCLANLIGDWALSIWDNNTESLILARDCIGLRQLYYFIDNNEITWSTILDPLVLFADRAFVLSEEYIAGWLSFYPATHLTPYGGIQSVPPSSLVLLRQGKQTIRQYWDFDPGKRIHYASDGAYEEHFRAVFAESIRRRLQSGTPILAELSGGMDSSSIICMADAIISSGRAETSRLDTISCYNDSEPNWDERPYFTKVEERRGRAGLHINLTSHEMFRFELEDDCFLATPGCVAGHTNAATKLVASAIKSQNKRVLLSGMGGDEVLGGVPTPSPELQDLLARLRLRELAHQLMRWALFKRKPWFHLLLEAIREFFPAALVGISKSRKPMPWLDPRFVSRNLEALHGYDKPVRLYGALPSFQVNLFTLDGVRRQLASKALASQPPYEARYPYLDRSLLEFVYSIPREQLVRVGQRRSLMRRALRGIVPDEILDRKRKAFVSRSPRLAIGLEWPRLSTLSHQMSSASLGIVDDKSFAEYLQKARSSEDVPITRLMRTLFVEVWLRNLRQHGILAAAEDTH